MRLWRLRKTHDLLSQAGESGNVVVQFSLSLKAREPGLPMFQAREDECPNSSTKSTFALLLPFCSVEALKGLADAHCISESDLL